MGFLSFLTFFKSPGGRVVNRRSNNGGENGYPAICAAGRRYLSNSLAIKTTSFFRLSPTSWSFRKLARCRSVIPIYAATSFQLPNFFNRMFKASFVFMVLSVLEIFSFVKSFFCLTCGKYFRRLSVTPQTKPTPGKSGGRSQKATAFVKGAGRQPKSQ